MTTFIIKAQGYGGGGPSLRPFETTSLQEAINEIEDLLDSDHSVKLYKLDYNGKEIPMNYTAHSYTKVYIGEE
jgi:hypothetical protein